MRAAVDNVQHRHGQRERAITADALVQRLTLALRCGACRCHRHAQYRVGTKFALIRRAIYLDQQVVQRYLVQRGHSQDGRLDVLVDILDGLEHTAPSKARGVAVAQFQRLVRARARAGRNERPPDGAVRQRDIHLDRRVAPRIEDFSCFHIRNCRHTVLICYISQAWSICLRQYLPVAALRRRSLSQRHRQRPRHE